MMGLLTEPEMRTAMERLPRDLHPLLVWLVTGQHVTGSRRDGTA